MTLPYVDFVIEVYRDCYWVTPHGYFYRFIPVGTTFEALPRSPDFVWYGQFHPGYSLPLDYPCDSYHLAYIPPILINSTKSTLIE